MHLIRLLRMGLEILRDAEVNVRRPDAEELLAIRNGEFSYDELVQMAKDLEAKVIEAEKTTMLPKVPDHKFINELLFDTLMVQAAREKE